MSFDIEPDGDPHGECAAEIKRLEAELSSLRQPADGDLEAAEKFASQEYDPKNGSYPNNAWTNQKDCFLAGCTHARTQSQAEIASLKAEVREYREALKQCVKVRSEWLRGESLTLDPRYHNMEQTDGTLVMAREALAKHPEREG